MCACHHDVHIEAPSLVSDELNQTFPVSTCSNFTNDTIAENIISKCNSSSVENELQRKQLVELVRNMQANLVPAAPGGRVGKKIHNLIGAEAAIS